MTDNKTHNPLLLVSCVLASFITPFMSSSINVALPVIGREFDMNPIMLNWVATSFLLASAIFLLPMGRLSDIYGKKLIFLSGLVVYTLTSLALVFSFNSIFLISIRIIQGIGASMIFSTSVALLISVYPPNQRGKLMGILVTAVYFGISVGPVGGGLITHYYGWRSLFAFNTFLGLIATLFVAMKLSVAEEKNKTEKFDFLGSLIYGIGLASMMYGFSKIPSVLGLTLTAAGLAGIVVFVIYENRLTSPVLHVNLLMNNKVFAYSNFAALINYSATFATGFLLSLYLQNIKGFNADHTGMILISQPIIMALFSSLSGKLSDRVEPRILATTGMSLDAIGLFFLFFLTPETPTFLIVIDLIVIGFGFALFSSPNMNAIMGSIDKKFYGVGSAIQGTMRLVGQMMSMGFAMVIFSVITGKMQMKGESGPLLMQSISFTFLIFALLCLAGIWFSAVRGNLHKTEKHYET